jgi:hypothetical protein
LKVHQELALKVMYLALRNLARKLNTVQGGNKILQGAEQSGPGDLRQLCLEQMQFGFSASGDQGKAFGIVAGENGIRVADAFLNFIVRIEF